MVTAKEVFRSIPLASIDPDPDQPRKSFAGIAELAASIDDVGLLQPPVVKPIGKRFQLVAGERRYQAAKAAGRREIVCAVREFADEAQAMLAQLVENFQRQELNPLEQCQAFARLCAPVAEGGGGLTQAEAGKKFGLCQSAVANRIRLLKLPAEWKQRVALGELCEAKARLILKYVDEPAFLETVATDMEQNPWAWQTVADWNRSLELLRSDDPPAAAPPRPRAVPVAAAIKTQEIIAPPAAPVPAIAGGVGELVDVELLCLTISQLTRRGDLKRVQEAVTERRAQLERRSKVG